VSASPAPAPRPLAEIVADLHAAGIQRICSFAWRDVDDPEAGGSEVHADEIFSRWAAAGLKITHRTSRADHHLALIPRNYQVIQRGGRMSVFARVATRQITQRTDRSRAVVEIWNGVPWGSPLWRRGPGVVWLHHVHEEMWNDALPGPLAGLGRLLETRIAPRFYRSSKVITLAASSADRIAEIGIPRTHIEVIPPGVHPRFELNESVQREPDLLVVVARLAPVKRIHLIFETAHIVRTSGRPVQVEVIGDGPLRAELTEWIRVHQAEDWITLRGRVDEGELVKAYQRAQLLVSASHAEGWGMSITEAGACGTPAVVTDISGHRDAVIPDSTGLLVTDRPIAQSPIVGSSGDGSRDSASTLPIHMAAAIHSLLDNPQRWAEMSKAARAQAESLSWDRVAAAHLEALASEVLRAQVGGTTGAAIR
jgi:glycosyltransferase involved in cell wall biosynthesis